MNMILDEMKCWSVTSR